MPSPRSLPYAPTALPCGTLTCHARALAAVALAAVALAAVALGCEPSDADGDAGPREAGALVDGGADVDGGVPVDGGPDCDPVLALDPVDVGTHCAGASIDVPLGLDDAIELTAVTLPDGVALALEDGAWRLRGTVPAGDAFVDASFVVAAVSEVDGCTSEGTLAVSFIIDPCDGGDGTCGPFADAYPIEGFCLPAAIDVDTAFTITTLIGACLGSSCHEVRGALCDVTVDAAAIAVDGDACVRTQNESGCSEDCSGGDGAPCTIGALAAGDYVMTSSSGELPFTVPHVESPVTGPLCLFPF